MSARMMLLHDGQPLAPHDLWRAWTADPLVVSVLLDSALLYGVGVHRLWRRAGIGHGVARAQAGLFAAGLLVLILALVSPLHALGSALFSAHMAQHTLLLVVAAPLLVLGRPVVAMLWALPKSTRLRVRSAARSGPLPGAWQALTTPLHAWALHAGALWLWHAPALYQGALYSEAAHALQHVSFFGTGVLFWYALLDTARRRMYGVSALYVVSTAMHSAALGAILTLSGALWYPDYGAAAQLWGLSPLRDQQLAGWIMWMPMGIAYLIATLALLAAWLRLAEVRVLRREASMLLPLLVVIALAGCAADETRQQAAVATGGRPERGPAAIRKYGCGACHTIDGVTGAHGRVGPSLDGVAMRAYIGGAATNSPENLVGWIRNPKAFSPNTAMPVLGVTDRDARDIAAYLYTLQW